MEDSEVRVAINVRVPLELRRKLDKKAAKEKRSLAFLVTEAVEQYLASKAA